MSATKVRLLDQETLDGLDEMLPRLHITGKLAQELVRNARWAAKVAPLLHSLDNDCTEVLDEEWETPLGIEHTGDLPGYFRPLRERVRALLAEIASPGGTDAHD